MQFKYEELFRFNSKLFKEFNVINHHELPNEELARSEFKSYVHAILNTIKQLQAKNWSSERDLLLEKENNNFLQKQYDNQIKINQIIEVELIKERKLSQETLQAKHMPLSLRQNNCVDLDKENANLNALLFEQEKLVNHKENEINNLKNQIVKLNQEIHNFRFNFWDKTHYLDSFLYSDSQGKLNFLCLFNLNLNKSKYCFLFQAQTFKYSNICYESEIDKESKCNSDLNSNNSTLNITFTGSFNSDGADVDVDVDADADGILKEDSYRDKLVYI